jgi:DNA primase
MGKYNLSEVKTKKEIKQWLDFPSRLYKNDPYYVRPIDNEVENVFDRSQNKLFRHGDAIRFILKDEKGNIVGRIAAFYDEKNIKYIQQRRKRTTNWRLRIFRLHRRPRSCKHTF